MYELSGMTVIPKPRARKTDDPEAVISEFVEQLGLIGEADGLPRISGRILGLLVIYGGPLSFTEIAQRLQVSRGSVSTNTRLLEHFGIIERVARSGERQDYFSLAPDPYYRLISGISERKRRAQAIVNKAKDALPLNWSDAKKRLASLSSFYGLVSEVSETLSRDLKSKT
jgi:DNA-binding transcriptional regulator GbsR (MarR family)